jgi:hypothetical protein
MQCMVYRLYSRQTQSLQQRQKVISLIARYLRFVEFRRNVPL